MAKAFPVLLTATNLYGNTSLFEVQNVPDHYDQYRSMMEHQTNLSPAIRSAMTKIDALLQHPHLASEDGAVAQGSAVACFSHTTHSFMHDGP